MSLSTKSWLRDMAIHYLKALAFGACSYILMWVIYGGVRLSFLAWIAAVLGAFTIAYIPFFLRRGKEGRDEGKKGPE